MPKAIVFTQHALNAMRERALELQWVTRAVEAPEWQEVDPQDAAVSRRFRAIPESGGRYLRVACVETATDILILSAFLDRRARPK